MPFRKVLLVKPSGRAGLSFLMDQIPLGLEYIAAYIEGAVDEVNIVDMEMENRSFRQILDHYVPDIVGFTMSATEHNEGLRLASLAKKKRIVTIVGGYHPTAVPDLMLSYPQIDMVARGEGEITMKELVEKAAPQDILGISYKQDGQIIHNANRPFIKNLDSLPFPARHLRQYSYKGNDQKADYDVILTSRGCYGRCTFCCEPSMSNGHLRCRSPENVVKEIFDISEFHEKRRVSVIIADPDFVGKPERVERICDLLKGHNLNMEFCGLVRTATMARRPELVRKMCEVGILYFEMGIESPNLQDLNSTRKGISTKIHREAVRNVRRYGGGAGGTFIIGLPDQTEEEIRYFPVYAREIGMTAAAFGIVTPFPGTEFYEELDKQRLIFETNWDNFDEMHSVYRTKFLSKNMIEELATYCMAKFWNIDTFIDRERVFQRRTKKKRPLIEFIVERVSEVQFMGNAGKSLKKHDFSRYVKIFFEAYPDPRVEAYTQKVGVHNVLEMSRFLRILGPQVVQCTLNLGGSAAISFVFKTTKDKVEYIRIMRGKQREATVDIEIDAEWMSEKGIMSKKKITGDFLSRNGSIRRLWSTFRLFAAMGTELALWKLSSNK